MLQKLTNWTKLHIKFHKKNEQLVQVVDLKKEKFQLLYLFKSKFELEFTTSHSKMKLTLDSNKNYIISHNFDWCEYSTIQLDQVLGQKLEKCIFIHGDNY